MKIIGKIALSLILPTLMTINVYGEETSATTTNAEGTTTEEATTTNAEGTTTEEATTTNAEGTTTEEATTTNTEETTTEEKTTSGSGCTFPPACPPDPSKCCSK